MRPDFSSRNYCQVALSYVEEIDKIYLIETSEVTHAHGLCHFCSAPVNGE